MISLYDYLGRAGGKELGGRIAAYANKVGAKSEDRNISNPKYTGPVTLHEEELFDEYARLHPEENLVKKSVIGTNRSTK
jgi:hypothetical protein